MPYQFESSVFVIKPLCLHPVALSQTACSLRLYDLDKPPAAHMSNMYMLYCYEFILQLFGNGTARRSNAQTATGRFGAKRHLAARDPARIYCAFVG